MSAIIHCVSSYTHSDNWSCQNLTFLWSQVLGYMCWFENRYNSCFWAETLSSKTLKSTMRKIRKCVYKKSHFAGFDFFVIIHIIYMFCSVFSQLTFQTHNNHIPEIQCIEYTQTNTSPGAAAMKTMMIFSICHRPTSPMACVIWSPWMISYRLQTSWP